MKQRELLPVPLNEEAKQFKLIYRELNFTCEILDEALISIQDEIICAITFDNYSPKAQKAEVTILNEKEEKIGLLKISLINILSVNGKSIYVYKIYAAHTHLLPFHSLIADNFVYAMKKRIHYRAKDANRLRRLFIYYLKPRPSFFLSVNNTDNFDIFPVDLAGNIFENYLTIAVKSTNAAIEIIKNTGNLCLSALPFTQSDLIYKHSEQRKNGNMRKENMLFNISESRVLKIPVPEFAINVNELQVEQTFQQGAYTVFIMKSVNKYTLSDAPQLAHTPWYNKQFFI